MRCKTIFLRLRKDSLKDSIQKFDYLGYILKVCMIHARLLMSNYIMEERLVNLLCNSARIRLVIKK